MATQNPPENSRKKAKAILMSALVVLVSAVSLSSIMLQSYYSTKILPNTTINNIDVGGLTIEQATEKISSEATPPDSHELKVAADDIVAATSSGSLDLHYDFDQAVKQAFLAGKTGEKLGRAIQTFKSLFGHRRIQANLAYNEEKLLDFITNLKMSVDIIGDEPEAILETTGGTNIRITPGKLGKVLETDKTISKIQELLNKNQHKVDAVVTTTGTELTEEQQLSAKNRASNLVGQKITLVLDADSHLKLDLDDKTLISFLNFPKSNSYKTDLIKEKIDEWAKIVNREPQDAVFDYDQKTLKVKKFVPHKLGLELSSAKTVTDLEKKITEIEKYAEGNGEEGVGENKSTGNTESMSEKEGAATAAANKEDANKNKAAPPKPEVIASSTTTSPVVTLDKTNSLGIKERIGYGESEYAHSIPNRIYNVSITTERVSDIIVAPGEEFSFNKALGEVSARTGFRSAYVIKNGRTELGDGGGVCQVSTTLFRSVINAGLDVTLRLPHSYRVSYYELDSKPGIDATVYSGNVDFRFKNDTNRYILIHGEADSQNLTMYYEIYGTSDGRTTQIVDHKTWDARSAPEPEYFDDPSLPAGTVRQIDFATGGVKASFKNIIKDKNGKIIKEDEYYSNYRPWSAKYLVGVGE